MKWLLTITLSVLTTLAILWSILNFVTWDTFEKFMIVRERLGSTITTILGTDTLSASRSVINTNFSNLNTDKAESGSTLATLTVTTLTAPTITNTTLNGVTGIFSTLTSPTLTIGRLLATTTATSSFSGGAYASLLSAPYFHATSTTASSTFAGGVGIPASGTSTALTLNSRPFSFLNFSSASNTVWQSNGQGFYSQIGTEKTSGVISTSTGSIGTIVVTHGLNRTPRTIRMWAFANCAQDGNASGCSSAGIANSATTTITNTANQSAVSLATRSGATVTEVTVGAIVKLIDGANNDDVVASISAVSGTTFTLNVSTNHNSGGTRVFQWEAE